MQPGTVIYLNGSSSAGKSTLGRALQELLGAPYLLLGIDSLFGAVTGRLIRAFRVGSPEIAQWSGIAWVFDEAEHVQGIEFGEEGRRLPYGLHSMVAALAGEGNNVIVDDVIMEPDMALHCAAALVETPAHIIGVCCALEVLEERERARGDRHKGLARYLHQRPHLHIPFYDFEVDSGAASPEACASAIRDYLEKRSLPRALSALQSPREASERQAARME